MNDNVIIKTEKLCKFYNGGEIKALNNVNTEIKKGEVVVIIGPSGSQGRHKCSPSENGNGVPAVQPFPPHDSSSQYDSCSNEAS